MTLTVTIQQFHGKFEIFKFNKMRVVQLKRGRIVKFATIGLFIVGLLLFIAHKSGYKLRSESDYGGVAAKLQLIQDQIGGENGGSSHQKGQSYPEDLPNFLGSEKKAGNFEPPADVKVTKSTEPGENGKSIKVRVEQKTEEERLKGQYFT